MDIRPLDKDKEAEVCAKLMASSEPWKTLKRGYRKSLEIIKDPLREVYLAFIEGEITGFIILVMRGAFTGYVQSIYVSPKHRGKGIGTHLMDYAEKRIFSETKNVFICVSDFNESAMRLYLKRGYKVIGNIPDYIIAGSSEILLRKTIGPLIN
jgi:ribosomal protein S18 acetylase RimI-like enzyme